MGGVLHPLKEEAIQNLINQLKAKSVSNVALCLLHSYKNQEHEAALGQALNRAGIRHISISSGLSQAIQYVSRTQTTAVNGYLKPVLHSYLQGIRQALGGQPLHIMTSAGGLVGFNHFHPKDSLFSGPAGGLTGAAAIAQSKGRERVLTFDMGGTSTDVARYLRGFDYQYVTTVGQAQIQSPSLAIETVAAGGGSVCGYDGYRLTVGPDSAGASPGPAAYGAG
ncbi:MAG TPA: 5-oxoprolinase, partial [Cytophagales bacterium]|nr:5-oxoprolinase [Cytophagales bacterium]